MSTFAGIPGVAPNGIGGVPIPTDAVNIPQPAPGASIEADYVVPAGRTIMVLSAFFNLSAAAGGGNRLMSFEYRYPDAGFGSGQITGHILETLLSDGQLQPGGVSYEYCAAINWPFGSPAYVAGSGFKQCVLPAIWLPPGFKFGVNYSGGQAGDQLTAIKLLLADAY